MNTVSSVEDEITSINNFQNFLNDCSFQDESVSFDELNSYFDGSKKKTVVVEKVFSSDYNNYVAEYANDHYIAYTYSKDENLPEIKDNCLTNESKLFFFMLSKEVYS